MSGTSDPSKALITNAPVVALAAWLVPGGGYFLIGQRSRALTVSITILLLFVIGLWIGGIKIVATPYGGMQESTGGGFGALFMRNPWFIAQVLTGPIGLIVGHIATNPMFPMPHAHAWEIGTLYTAIAGMLNLLTIIDSAYRGNRLEAKR